MSTSVVSSPPKSSLKVAVEKNREFKFQMRLQLQLQVACQVVAVDICNCATWQQAKLLVPSPSCLPTPPPLTPPLLPCLVNGSVDEFICQNCFMKLTLFK